MDDYRDVRSIAVHREDVAAAVETNRTSDTRAVLRVTPPFSGRMRARLHVERDDDPETLHIDPANLVTEGRSRPTPDETADRLRADPDTEYSLETHRERHAAAVAAWRADLAVVDRVELDGEYGPHRVAVVALG